jgi:hypothetical protein
LRCHHGNSTFPSPAAGSLGGLRVVDTLTEALDGNLGGVLSNSVERLLVDTLMQVQSQYEHWLEVLTARTTLQALHESEEEARWQPPRVTDSEAIEQAAEMVDRFHRIMMRTIRQLQNLRRNPPVVTVQKARQVNVGQRQVNAVAGG